jgi:competence protein ComFC
MRQLGALKDLFFPQVRCLNCDEPRMTVRGEALCSACQQKLEGLHIPASACPHCLSPRSVGQACAYCAGSGMQNLDAAYSPFVYHGVAQKLIVQLKFGPYEIAAAPLANAMAMCVSGQAFDAMVPVPLHKSGLRERGINQSRFLCDLISPLVHLPVLDALSKQRRTKRQSSLLAASRAENVKDAFALQLPVKGLRVLLVDDVRTSGSTARECARVLKSGSAEGVSLLTAAVAARKN